jgi:hypothetical protein
MSCSLGPVRRRIEARGTLVVTAAREQAASRRQPQIETSEVRFRQLGPREMPWILQVTHSTTSDRFLSIDNLVS